MRKLVYDVAASLDGYIAGPDHDVSAFLDEGDHVAAYLKRLQGYDTVLMACDLRVRLPGGDEAG